MARFFKDAKSVYFKPGKAAHESFEAQFFREPVLWKLLLISALTYLIWSGKVAIVLNTGSAVAGVREFSLGQESSGHSVRTSSIFKSPDAGKVETAVAPRPAPIGVELPAGSLNNVTFAVDPRYGQRNAIDAAEVEKRMATCRDYVERFAPVAIAEMRKYGIPASVTLAQALLESNAGDSQLATRSNNHFGIKCFSKSCKKGHCVNFSDDSHKDFFIRYTNVWGSYRAHSELLQGKNAYRALFNLAPADYRAWARGLSKAGYATDKRYAEKLIALIENLELQQYDQQ